MTSSAGANGRSPSWILSLSDEATEARLKGNAKAEWMRPLLTADGPATGRLGLLARRPIS